MYREYRKLPADDQRRVTLREQIQAIYSAALRDADESWAMVLAKSSRTEKASGNVSQKSLSFMTEAVWKTSSASTSSQRGLSSSSTAHARSRGEPSSSRMAGRQSQLQNENFMGDTSQQVVDGIDAEINALERELAATSWHLDRRVPVVLIIAIMVQTVGVVWWAASLSARVDALERDWASFDAVTSRLRVQGDRLARSDERQQALYTRLERIERKLDMLLERK